MTVQKGTKGRRIAIGSRPIRTTLMVQASLNYSVMRFSLKKNFYLKMSLLIPVMYPLMRIK